jgi:hypothetical protein
MVLSFVLFPVHTDRLIVLHVEECFLVWCLRFSASPLRSDALSVESRAFHISHLHPPPFSTTATPSPINRTIPSLCTGKDGPAANSVFLVPQPE